MIYQKPKALQPGMCVSVIAPASGLMSDERLDLGIERLKAQGFRVKEGAHLRERLGFLASTDKNRLSDLLNAFADPEVDAIMCMRGGYGTMRLLDSIDYDLIRSNPKVFVGFSDITALHLAFLKCVNLVSFNGLMLTTTLGAAEPSAYTIERFMSIVGSPDQALGSVWGDHPDGKRLTVPVTSGKASGILTGGNLSLVAATIGTPYEIETKGRIVFLEDVDETPYKFDRMLTQMMLSRKLYDAAAIVFGRNVPDRESEITEKELGYEGIKASVEKCFPKTAERSWYPIIDQVIADRLRPLGIPVIIGLPFGHIDHYATLPIGCNATIDVDSGKFTIDEPAVM